MTTCRSCGAEVVFVPSAKTGKPMILDAAPSKGVVVATPDGLAASLGFLAREHGDQYRASVVDVYTDHHVTCPEAAAWKGKTRSAGTPA